MVIRHREFALVRVVGSSGAAGYAFTLTRDASVAATVTYSIADLYVGESCKSPSTLYAQTRRRNLASLSSGIGLRALSLVDLATWDMTARSLQQPISALLAERPLSPLPVTAVVGYPPSLEPELLALQVGTLYESGWRRFKMPIASTYELTYSRIAAAVSAAPGCWIGLDAAWTFDDAETVAAFVAGVPIDLDCLEDVFPPDETRALKALRNLVRVPIAMGDDQGGAYYPDALLESKAVDVIRIDLTCMGGISGGLSVVRKCVSAGVACSPHMFGHVHAQVFGALGLDVPIEWGFPGAVVDPFEASLGLPVVEDGRMKPFPSDSGFGSIVNKEWLSDNWADDPDNIIGSLETI